MLPVLILFIILIVPLLYAAIEEGTFQGKKEDASRVVCADIEVRESPFGLGCFAKRDFKKGEIIEKGIMTPMEGVDGNVHSHMFSWSDDKKLFAVGSGCLPFYNHSDEPNIIKIGDLTHNTMVIETLRDVSKGEELRNRYISKAWRGCFQSF
jgi:hypothetical protein